MVGQLWKYLVNKILLKDTLTQTDEVVYMDVGNHNTPSNICQIFLC